MSTTDERIRPEADQGPTATEEEQDPFGIGGEAAEGDK